MGFQLLKTTMNDVAIFTVCNIAYLPKVLVLAESLEKMHLNKIKVVLFDKKQNLPDVTNKLEIIWLENLGFQFWKQLAFKYDIIELSTSLKPFIANKFLNTYNKVIFLDPDTSVYSSLEPLLTELDNYPVILTPHYIKPQPSTAHESDLGMMRFGSFNLGFFALRKSEEAINFLDWWHQRCVDFCFMESQFGLSTDQKWVSIAPCFFDFLKISFNPGYNAAPWNTFERRLTRKQGAYFVNESVPLVFFHFSNFDHNDPQYLNKRASIEIGQRYEVLEELGKEYSERLKHYEVKFKHSQYDFDFMSDGTYISPTLRRAYASIESRLPQDIDPFDSAGVIGKFARKNGLVTKDKNSRYRYPKLKDATQNKVILSFIYWFLRLFIRLFGPNKFFDLSKLMVFLSLMRSDHKYWKL